MLELKNINISLKKNFNYLLKDFNFTLKQGNKVAVIGEEGNGKSTLLKLIYDSSLIDDYCEFSGDVIKKGLKIEYLEQALNPVWHEATVNEYFLKKNPNEKQDFDDYDKLNEISEILVKLHLDSTLAYSEQLMKTLSGGEKIKVQLAKIIYKNADILLLDEPTNDLDINTLKWLEKFINESNIPIMFISHDETLLENTANVIIHMEQLKKKKEAKYSVEKIGYKEYIEKRLGMIEHQGQVARKQRADHKAQMEKFRQIYQKVEYQQETITRADPHGGKLLKKKIKSMKSLEKRYEREREDFLDIPDVEEAINVSFDSDIYIPNGKTIIKLDIDSLVNADKLLATNIKLNIKGPKHIVIIGVNGSGKTTLMRIIYEELKNRDDIIVGYMPQNYEELLNSNEKAMDFIKRDTSKDEMTLVKTYLGAMKFTTEEMEMPIKDLSGGQKAKILLLKLILNKFNVLLLDEPTRNLSPLSNPVIRNMLSSYNGAIISISHDRKFIDEVCDSIYELTYEGLIKHDDLNDFNTN